MQRIKLSTERLRRKATQLILLIGEILLACLPAWLVSLWALPYAYRFRGYQAVGGEWILIIGVALLAFFIVHSFTTGKEE